MAGKTSNKSTKVAKKAPAKRVAAKPSLSRAAILQIAKGYGDAPVQAYIAAMPGWKRDVGRRLDALIVRDRPRRAQGGQMELALLWRRGRSLVPQLPLLHATT